MIKQGKSLDEIQGAAISKDYDDTWGTGFINAESFTGFLYKSLSANNE